MNYLSSKILHSSLLYIFILMLLSGCKAYHIITASLLQQMASTNESKKKVFGAFGLPVVYKGNNIKQIKVLDKNENEYLLSVNIRTGIRITKKDGTRQTFYFNTLLVHDSTITGKNDHISETEIKTIKIKYIDKIEL